MNNMTALNNETDAVLFLCVCVIGFTFSLMPTIVAFRRHHINRFAIMLVNIFLGWSVIGWFIALFWAYSKDKRIVVTQTHGPVRNRAKAFYRNGEYDQL